MPGDNNQKWPIISEAEYIELVDFTGRELHPGKRGKILASEPNAPNKLGITGPSALRALAQVTGVSLAKLRDCSTKPRSLASARCVGIGFERILKKI